MSYYSIAYCDRPISDKDDEFTKLQVLKSNGWAIRHLTKPSVGLQLAAVRESGFAIDKIKNASEVVRLENHNVWHVKWKPNCCSIGYEEFWINLLSKADSPLFRSLPLDMIKKIAKMLAEMPMEPRMKWKGKYLKGYNVHETI